jgi:hypothetical protein
LQETRAEAEATALPEAAEDENAEDWDPFEDN